jgi:hypothetical protein
MNCKMFSCQNSVKLTRFLANFLVNGVINRWRSYWWIKMDDTYNRLGLL